MNVTSSLSSVHGAFLGLWQLAVVRGDHFSPQVCQDGLHGVVPVPVVQGCEDPGIDLQEPMVVNVLLLHCSLAHLAPCNKLGTHSPIWKHAAHVQLGHESNLRGLRRQHPLRDPHVSWAEHVKRDTRTLPSKVLLLPSC